MKIDRLVTHKTRQREREREKEREATMWFRSTKN